MFWKLEAAQGKVKVKKKLGFEDQGKAFVSRRLGNTRDRDRPGHMEDFLFYFKSSGKTLVHSEQGKDSFLLTSQKLTLVAVRKRTGRRLGVSHGGCLHRWWRPWLGVAQGCTGVCRGAAHTGHSICGWTLQTTVCHGRAARLLPGSNKICSSLDMLCPGPRCERTVEELYLLFVVK